MFINIPVSEKSEEVNRNIKSYFKPFLGCSLQPSCFHIPTTRLRCADPMHIIWVRHSVVTFCSTYSPLQVLEFKLFQPYSILTKTFVQIFSLIFLKISGRAEALQPL